MNCSNINEICSLYIVLEFRLYGRVLNHCPRVSLQHSLLSSRQHTRVKIPLIQIHPLCLSVTVLCTHTGKHLVLTEPKTTR